MKILHILPNLCAGGAERQFSYLAPALAHNGHAVHVAYSREGTIKPDLPGVVTHRLVSASNYDPSLLWQLALLVRRLNPDIVQTWILQTDILGGMAAVLNRTPWILREPNQSRCYPLSWKHRLRVCVGSRAAAIVSNSRGGDDYWAPRVSPGRRYIISNALPQHEMEKTEAAWPPGFAPSGSPVILFVGRLEESQKRPMAWLTILARVREQCGVKGILCGEGPALSALKERAHALRLDADVCFAGQLPATAIWALMKKASALLSLSAYEGCPNAVMEAMACGCPLVLSEIPAHREIIDEQGALFVESSDTEKAAEAVLRVLRGGGEAEQRAIFARGKTKEWSIPTMTRNYENMYEEVMARYHSKKRRIDR